jgi:hypothetical protein
MGTAITAPRRVWRRQMRRRYTTMHAMHARRCRNAAHVGAKLDKKLGVAMGKMTKRESTVHSAHRNIRTTLSLATQDAPPTHNLVHSAYSALPQRRHYWRQTR